MMTFEQFKLVAPGRRIRIGVYRSIKITLYSKIRSPRRRLLDNEGNDNIESLSV